MENIATYSNTEVHILFFCINKNVTENEQIKKYLKTFYFHKNVNI